MPTFTTVLTTTFAAGRNNRVSALGPATSQSYVPGVFAGSPRMGSHGLVSVSTLVSPPPIGMRGFRLALTTTLTASLTQGSAGSSSIGGGTSSYSFWS